VVKVDFPPARVANRMRWVAMADHMNFDPHKINVHFIAGRLSIKENIDLIKREVEQIGGVVLIIVDTAAAIEKSSK
jgi:hypothetical protein